MKPLSFSVQNTRRRFPVTDYSYQSATLREFKPSCAGAPRPTFDLISRDYFNVEARRNFIAETVIFAAVAVTTIPALIDCGRAMAMFLRAIATM